MLTVCVHTVAYRNGDNTAMFKDVSALWFCKHHASLQCGHTHSHNLQQRAPESCCAVVAPGPECLAPLIILNCIWRHISWHRVLCHGTACLQCISNTLRSASMASLLAQIHRPSYE